MDDPEHWIRNSELDEISALEVAEQIAEFESSAQPIELRSYPGYPTFPLPRSNQRWWPSLDRVLSRRRSQTGFTKSFPSAKSLGQLLQLAHGVTGESGQGPTPSAGGLQALELFLVHWQQAWLPHGVYHYDRTGHSLSQIKTQAEQTSWLELVPSLRQVDGGALLWLIVGDSRRVTAKYGSRGDRYLLLEAGHLMQSLCLASASLGLCTLPLGGVLEGAIAKDLRLPKSDRVLYAGWLGELS